MKILFACALLCVLITSCGSDNSLCESSLEKAFGGEWEVDEQASFLELKVVSNTFEISDFTNREAKRVIKQSIGPCLKMGIPEDTRLTIIQVSDRSQTVTTYRLILDE